LEEYPGVVGVDEAALAFAERAEELGARFSVKVQQQILAVSDAPQIPNVAGCPRLASPADFKLFRAWVTSFIREAIPSDPIPGSRLSSSHSAIGCGFMETSPRAWLPSRAELDEPPLLIRFSRRASIEIRALAQRLPLMLRAKSLPRAEAPLACT
jgi:hypothetical protein